MTKSKSRISRRDFLKLSALTAGSALGASRYVSSQNLLASSKPNILIFVFDAMSARHLSLYGYARETTPNLEKFAERASVFHQHYSAANFTTSGTASMLTGLYPWTHRAINYRGMIDRNITDRNLFYLVGDEYVRFAFTQNYWADVILSQFEKNLDYHLPCDAFSQIVRSSVQPDAIRGDRAMGYYAFQDFLDLGAEGLNPFPGSLLLASADLSRHLTSRARDEPFEDYPLGLPTSAATFSYRNEDVFQGIHHSIKELASQTLPYLAYFHLWSPHDPYHPRQEYIGRFPDELQVSNKVRHPLANGDHSASELLENRMHYDEMVANVDAEFGQLMLDLESTNILQNSYVIVTSDHGELFERGELGHASALMYAPVTHIPLLIRAPGQTHRTDYLSMTTNLDLLPTLLTIAGKDIPNWLEGRLLPGFGGTEDANASRSFFPMMAKDNPTFQPLQRATFTLLKGPYELFFYTGYPDHEDAFELYNLREDPNELQDLFKEDINTASQMKEELLDTVSAANRSFQQKS
jgi:arylsulfatase A-like enzyme